MLKIESGDGIATAVQRKLGKYERIKKECNDLKILNPCFVHSATQKTYHMFNLRKLFPYFEFDSKSQEGRNITCNSWRDILQLITLIGSRSIT